MLFTQPYYDRHLSFSFCCFYYLSSSSSSNIQ